MQLKKNNSARGLLLGVFLLLGACTSVPRANVAPLNTLPGASVAPLNAVPSASTASLDILMEDPALNGAVASLTVRDASTGKLVYQHNSDTQLVPASNLKLLTTAAAMDVLGSDYRFATQVLGSASPSNGVLSGNLYLRGTGDPSIVAQDYRDLAAALARQGVRRIQGDLIFDDTWFDSVRLGADWADDDENAYYAAQISALSVAPDSDFNMGTVIVSFSAPAKAGMPLRVGMSPENRYLTIVNRASSGRGGGFQVYREEGDNRLIVNGKLAPGRTSASKVTVWEPTGLVADLFRQALAEQGIAVSGRSMLGGVTPPSAVPLAEHESMPLRDLILPLLKLSNNSMSEVLLKAMGRKTANIGSAEAGVVAVADFMKRQGISHSGFTQFDGSGLSRRNLISTNTLSELLIAARKQPWFESWYEALPIAGNPQRMIGGTLRRRLIGTVAANNLHAKTGSMGSVSSLSGYISTANGRPLVFSMVVNNFDAPAWTVKSLENRVALSLAE